MVIFPELCITGYTCADLFAHELLLKESVEALQQIADSTKGKQCIAIVGIPLEVNAVLLNCAVVLQNGKLHGIVPKTYLPTESFTSNAGSAPEWDKKQP